MTLLAALGPLFVICWRTAFISTVYTLTAMPCGTCPVMRRRKSHQLQERGKHQMPLLIKKTSKPNPNPVVRRFHSRHCCKP